MQLVQHGIRRHKAGAAEYLNLHPGETPPRYSANMDARLGQELGIAAKLLDKAAERICPGSKLGELQPCMTRISNFVWPVPDFSFRALMLATCKAIDSMSQAMLY